MMMDDLKALVQEFQTFDKNVAIDALKIELDDLSKTIEDKLSMFDVLSAKLKTMFNNWNRIAIADNHLIKFMGFLKKLKAIKSSTASALSFIAVFDEIEYISKISTEIVAELYNEVIAQVQIGDSTLGI
jgi:hypothetical protein